MFKSINDLIFRDIITKTSKSGNEYTQVILSDPVNYETYEFFAAPNVVITAEKGSLVVVELMCSKNGYNISLSVQSVKSIK